jgi:hypothetical protein
MGSVGESKPKRAVVKYPEYTPESSRSEEAMYPPVPTGRSVRAKYPDDDLDNFTQLKFTGATPTALVRAHSLLLFV